MQNSDSEADMAKRLSTFVSVTTVEKQNNVIRAAAIFMEAFTSQDGEVSAGAAVNTLQSLQPILFFSRFGGRKRGHDARLSLSFSLDDRKTVAYVNRCDF
jgi:hypothetical protein